MTERLYYRDSYETSFEARVASTGDLAGRPFVVLDRTAFYPTSGGQPFDTGTLVRLQPDAPGMTGAGARVVEVIDREEDGAVLHVLDGVVESGLAVRGTIDWARRFDHMQQHTGQHVLSAAFERLHRARTVSFHLGATSSTIDLDRDVPAQAVAAAEDEANRVVWDDRPVSVRFASAEEAASLPLRKEPQRSGPLRLVEIADCDLSACGGTHVARTGAIGVIAACGWERFKGGLRVEFLCGGRALRAYRTLRDAVAGSIRVLSVLPHELPDAIAGAQAENKQLRKTIRDLTEALAVHEAQTLAARGVRAGSVTVVAEALEGWDANGLKALATSIAAKPGHAAVLLTKTSPVLVVVARAADTDVDAGEVLKALVARFGGKGGGRADLAQGGGLAGDPAAIVAAALALVAGAPNPSA
jgi:alanyl-tRNA synthetase